MKMNLFGTFSLRNDKFTLDEESIHSKKLTCLLAYFIIFRGEPVTGRRLSELFWGGNSRNPESALKNLMYRMRGIMKNLGPEEYICTLHGAYQWNPDVPVETDYEEFERLDREIRAEQNRQIRKDLCQQAITCYHGEVSNVLADQAWLAPRLMRYRSIYADIAKTLGSIYIEEESWAELELLCHEVLQKEPFDEDIHGDLILSLKKQKKYDQALFQYENTKKQFYENFGVRVPDKVRQVFEEIVTEQNLERVVGIDMLMEEVGEKDEPSGAFFCDYQIFRQIYQLEMRRVSRMGISEYILLLTVRRKGRLWGDNIVDQALHEGVGILENILRNMLRIGDTVAQTGPTQFAVLLSLCSYEAGIMVVDRIQKEFQKRIKTKKLDIRFEMEELTSQWQNEEATQG